MRLKDLPDVKDWTITRSVVTISDAIINITGCVFDVLQDLYRLEPNDGLREVYRDIYALLDTMMLYTYEPDMGRLMTIPYPREKLAKLAGNRNHRTNINFDEAILLPEDYADDIIGEVNDDFNAMRMGSALKQPMRLTDALYIIHRSNIEVLLWTALVNRLIRKGILDVTATTIEAWLSIQLGMVAKSIQTVVRNRLPILNHQLPGKNDLLMTVEFQQCVYVDSCSQLEIRLFEMMGNPLPKEAFVPYLELRSAMYRLVPKA